MSDRTPRDAFLERHIEEWKATTPDAPAHLEDSILRAVRARNAAAADRNGAARDERSPAPLRWWKPAAWPRPVWAAAGAFATLLIVAAALAVRSATVISAPEQANRLLVSAALRDAETAEREHARAIARLQEAAQPTLARVSDPDLPGEHAARLMMLSNRLRFLDRTIDEIQSYVRDNPAHSGTRTTLLAAYTEKTEVLREVIALEEEISS